MFDDVVDSHEDLWYIQVAGALFDKGRVYFVLAIEPLPGSTTAFKRCGMGCIFATSVFEDVAPREIQIV